MHSQDDILSCETHSRSDSLVCDLYELYLAVDKGRVLVEELPEELLLDAHIPWGNMASRVANKDVLNIGALIHLEGIIQVIQIVYFGWVL